MEKLQEKSFDTAELTLNIAEGPPAGPPLLLIPGGGGRWQEFQPILPALTQDWHVYALDLRGHGRSGRVPGRYRPEQYVPDITAVLDQHIKEKTVLFGHSLGGWIALLTAAARPQKTHALILGDPPLNIKRFLAYEGSAEQKEMWRTLRDQLTTNNQIDPDVIFYHASGRLDEYVQHVNIESLLPQLTCPTLLLQADPSQGGLITDKDAQHALSLLPDGRYIQLKNSGHDLGLDAGQPDPLLRALSHFLETL